MRRQIWRLVLGGFGCLLILTLAGHYAPLSWGQLARVNSVRATIQVAWELLTQVPAITTIVIGAGTWACAGAILKAVLPRK